MLAAVALRPDFIAWKNAMSIIDFNKLPAFAIANEMAAIVFAVPTDICPL